METKWLNKLSSVSACDNATAWVKTQPNARMAWHACHRGDWLLWFAANAGVDRKLIVRAACDCAEKALKHVKPGEDRPRKAIETARLWCDGKATIEEVRVAADAATDAAAYAAAYAADAAAYADADDAAYAAYAAYAAAYADDARPRARARSLAEAADLVRKHISFSIIRKAAMGATNRRQVGVA